MKWVALGLVLVIAACGGGDACVGCDAEAPTAEEFAAAESCAELNRLSVRRDAAEFWRYAELTVAEAESSEVSDDENGFAIEPDELDRAFSDRQVELDCSDSEWMAALEAAIRERCEAWMDDGHAMDEEPLLVNTVFCDSR